MKKVLFKNWFWLVILLVAGIKYGTAQSRSAGVLYSTGTDYLNIGYGVHIQTTGIGILALTGGYLDESVNNITIDDIVANKKIYTGGEYTQLGITFPRIPLFQSPFEAIVGAGGTLRNRIYSKDGKVGTENDYTTWMLAGMNFVPQHSNIYVSVSFIGDFLDNSNKSLMFGLHYKF